MRLSLLATIAAAVTAPVLGSTNGYYTFHWHMQQPIYWPAASKANPNTYQFAAESNALKSQQGGHPRNDLPSIFGKADRVNDYTGSYPLSGVSAVGGASVSYSGCLIENVESLAATNQMGYGAGWKANYEKALQMKTPTGQQKLDLVAFTYHHAIMSLIDRNALEKQLEIHKVIYGKTWQQPYSKGIFPAEMVFTTRAIPILKKLGIEWSYVANNHVSRTCENYPYSASGDNIDPPNRADQVTPAAACGDSWFRESISRGVTPDNAFPFSYTPHRAKHVDPDSGAADTIVVVPMAMAMSWQDGYECTMPNMFASMAAKTAGNATRPPLRVAGHDGDNSWAGGNSYYQQCLPNIAQNAPGMGLEGTNVASYLAQFPVPEDDIVHVEDGGWVNAPDFGSAQATNWNWPLYPDPAKPPGPEPMDRWDIRQGWSPRQMQWAIITAAQSFVDHAEAAAGGVDIAEVQAPTSNATEAELAWHFYMPSLTSGYMYYGNVLDMPVKETVACNLAVSHAKAQLAASAAADTTAPTIWAPQRIPFNPGGKGMGELWSYKYLDMPTDFWIWTYVADAGSGVKSVTLQYRVDADGVNPLADHANEVFDPAAHGLSGVGPWQSLDMTARPFPKGAQYNTTMDLTCDASGKVCLPDEISDEYYVKVTGLTDTLIDYYIEATDMAGNVKKSDILHVYIGDGASASPSPSATVRVQSRRGKRTAKN